MKKEIIIVIRGANYIKSKSKMIQFFILKLYKLFNVIPDYKFSKEKWFSNLESPSRELIYFNWNGEFYPSEIEKASIDLLKLVHTKEQVKIVSCSLGTQIALKTLKKLNNNNIKKIISIYGVYRKIKSNVEFVDIRSNVDYFGNFFKFLFNLLSFSKMNINLVNLNNIRHDESHENKKNEFGLFENKRISNLIENYL